MWKRGGCRGACAPVFEICSAGASRLRSRLRPEPDRALGGASKTEKYGGRGEDGAAGIGAAMKPAFQKSESILGEIQSILKSGTKHLWWLGQSGFLVVQNGRALV